MNDIEKLEELLQKPPPLKVPRDLREKLQADVPVLVHSSSGSPLAAAKAQPPRSARRAIASSDQVVSGPSSKNGSQPFVSPLCFWPVSSPLPFNRISFSSCAARMRTEKRQSESGPLRQENLEYQKLRAESEALERLRTDNAELQNLRTEVVQLRQQAQELPALRSENSASSPKREPRKAVFPATLSARKIPSKLPRKKPTASPASTISDKSGWPLDSGPTTTKMFFLQTSFP